LKKTEKQQNAILGELFIKYRDVILFAVLRTLGAENESMAEDCLSQAFLIACQKKDELFSRDNPVLWLIATAKNCARHCKRTAIKEQSLFHPIDEETSEIADQSGERFVQDLIYEDWIEKGVPQKLIDELNPRVRQAFVAKYREHKSNAQIAKEMQISESTVRTFLHDAKKQIEERVRSGNL